MGLDERELGFHGGFHSGQVLLSLDLGNHNVDLTVTNQVLYYLSFSADTLSESTWLILLLQLRKNKPLEVHPGEKSMIRGAVI